MFVPILKECFLLLNAASFQHHNGFITKKLKRAARRVVILLTTKHRQMTPHMIHTRIGGATPGPAVAQVQAENAVPRLVPRLEKYWYFNIMSKFNQECAPSRDRRAPAVPRLVPKGGAATAYRATIHVD